MTTLIDPKHSAASIKSFASMVLRRVLAAGAASTTLDDIEQELWVAWCLAAEAYRPDMGCSFKTFLYTGMQRHINRYVEKNVQRRHTEVMASSLDQQVGDGDDSGTLAEVIPSADPSPGAAFEDDDMFAVVTDKMSPRARQFLTILKEQPPELLEEVRMIEQKSIYAKTKGQTLPLHNRLTSVMVLDLMDASRSERAKIMDEVERVGNRICKQVSQ